MARTMAPGKTVGEKIIIKSSFRKVLLNEPFLGRYPCFSIRSFKWPFYGILLKTA
jgi:hypothetical protein